MGTVFDATVELVCDLGCNLEFEDAMWAEGQEHIADSDKRYIAGRFEQACVTLARATNETREVWMTRIRACGAELDAEDAEAGR
jgi:hypothetical protein